MPQSSWALALAPQLLSLCSRAWEPQLLKPMQHGACARQQEKAPQREARARQPAGSPCSPKLEKSPRSNEEPAQPKIKKERIYFKKENGDNNTTNSTELWQEPNEVTCIHKAQG